MTDIKDKGDMRCNHAYLYTRLPERDAVVVVCSKCKFKMEVSEETIRGSRSGEYFEQYIRQQNKKAQYDTRYLYNQNPFTDATRSYGNTQFNSGTFTAKPKMPDLRRPRPKKLTRFAATKRWLLVATIRLLHWLRLTEPAKSPAPQPAKNPAPQPGSQPSSTPDPKNPA